jgi:hypothetical protein
MPDVPGPADASSIAVDANERRARSVLALSATRLTSRSQRQGLGIAPEATHNFNTSYVRLRSRR